ncbi:MAG: undecaprenyl-phosphate glucose phosphotransferase [Ignavibacteriaceae bacterium]
MQIYRKSLYLIRITIDISILIISFILSGHASVVHYRFFRETNFQFLLLSLIIIWFFTSKATNLYDEFRSRNVTFEIIALIKNITVILISSIVILFLLKEERLSRYFVIIFSLSNIILLSVEKIAFRKYLNFLRKRGRNLRNLLIVGAGEVGRSFYDLIEHSSHFGYKMVGFVDDSIKPLLNGQYLGKIDELDNILNEQHVDDIIIALPNYADDRLVDVITICEKHTTRVRIIPDYFKFVSGKYNVSMFGRFPIISVREDRINEMHWRMLKRSFDFIFTFSLYLFVFWWLWPLIGLLIKISSPGPVMYSQERWGRDNKRFIAYKFRSMHIDQCDEVNEFDNYKQAIKDDPRVTKIGKLLRKTNLDELPQFWNVLKGDMSIVGPRPHPTPLNIESKDKIHLYMLRHLVKPGITGWAQVNGLRGSTENPVLMQKRINHDIWYIENWSLWLDIQIIVLTIWNMIKGDKNAY